MNTALQYLLLICAYSSVRDMSDVCDELTNALRGMPKLEEERPSCDVLVLGYGVTTKAQQGFILFLVKGHIPGSFTQRIREDASITDFVYVHSVGEPGVPGLFVYGEPTQEQRSLPPPELPAGYFLLANRPAYCALMMSDI